MGDVSMKDCKVILNNDVATLQVVADKLDAMSNDMAKSGAMNISLSLKAQAMTIKNVVEGLM